jgi:hypothetical protein
MYMVQAKAKEGKANYQISSNQQEGGTSALFRMPEPLKIGKTQEDTWINSCSLRMVLNSNARVVKSMLGFAVTWNDRFDKCMVVELTLQRC